MTQKLFIEALNFFDLTEDKKSNLYYFITESIKKILNEFSILISNKYKVISIYANDYFFKFPKKTEQTFSDETYNISLYVPVEINSIKTNVIKKFNLFICNLPLILNNNSFWVNGIPKVIYQQFAFDPVVFIDPKNTENIQLIFYDDKQEKCLQISMDDNERLYFTAVDPILTNATHFSSDKLKTINRFLFFNTYNKNRTLRESGEKTKFSINKETLLSNINFIDSFKLTEKTRNKLNAKFRTLLPSNTLYLTKLDISKIKNLISKVKKYEMLIPDLDDLENKSIKYINEYLTSIIYYNLKFIEDHLKNENETNNNVFYLINKIQQNNISFEVDELFSNSDVSLPIEQVNPLTELAQQRKFLNLKKQEGNENISLDIRNIHFSNFGRLCPIDTPEGDSAGLITSLVTLALSNKFGWLETPEFYLKNGKEIINEKVRFNGLHNEDLKTVKFALNQQRFFSVNLKENIKIDKEFSETNITNIDSTYLSYLQVFSLSCSNIPFLEHNDGNRMLMGANMQKQAVPLLFPENAVVSSGIEEIIASSSDVVKSLSSGNVIYCDSTKIIVKTQNNKNLIYFLDRIKPTFNETIINNVSCCWIGEKVYFGQILANGFSIKNSELSLGTNLTVAYMNWDGYNFEDAIIISDRLIKNDKLTSLHSKTILIEILDSEEIYYINPSLCAYATKNKLTNFGIISKNKNIKVGDILIVKIITSDENAKRLVFVESDFDGYISNIELKTPETKTQTNLKIEYHNKILKLDVLQTRKIQVGDKLSGRFGNKGVISRILPEVDMPFLLDGTPVDILLNPLGIPSRMNIGQIFETLLGFVGINLHRRFKLLSFDECFGKYASKVLVNQKLKENKLFLKQAHFLLNDNGDKTYVVDGRSGEIMDNPVLVGKTYILKLFHLAQDKLASRTIGPNSLLTNQPLKGKKSKGGQRFGEMEVWALEAYGASYTLNEMLGLKSDDIFKNEKLEKILEKDKIFDQINYSKSLFVLDLDLKALGFDLKLNIDNFIKNTSYSTDILSEFKSQDILMPAAELLKNIYSIYERK